MTNYRVQDGCHNCKHRVEIADAHFCSNGNPRPQWGARLSQVQYIMEMDSWLNERHIAPFGICDEWEPIKAAPMPLSGVQTLPLSEESRIE